MSIIRLLVSLMASVMVGCASVKAPPPVGLLPPPTLKIEGVSSTTVILHDRYHSALDRIGIQVSWRLLDTNQVVQVGQPTSGVFTAFSRASSRKESQTLVDVLYDGDVTALLSAQRIFDGYIVPDPETNEITLVFEE